MIRRDHIEKEFLCSKRAFVFTPVGCNGTERADVECGKFF